MKKFSEYLEELNLTKGPESTLFSGEGSPHGRMSVKGKRTYDKYINPIVAFNADKLKNIDLELKNIYKILVVDKNLKARPEVSKDFINFLTTGIENVARAYIILNPIANGDRESDLR